MSTPRGDRTVLRSVVACLLVVGLGVALFAATGALATHEEERTTDGFKAYTPGGEIPNPGDVMSVELYMAPAHMEREGPIPPDVEVRVDFMVFYTTTMSNCDTQDVYALGVDRGNDLPHTEYDDDLVQSLMANGDTVTDPSDDPAKMTTNEDWTHRQYSWLEMADPEDWPKELIFHPDGVEDESIVATDDCVEMPDPGWHRTFGMINGTITGFHGDRDSVTVDGETLHEGDGFEIWDPSLWYPVCDCEESRHVAMELDPPPGKMTRGSEGGVIHPNGTIEAPYAEVNESGWLIYPKTTVPPENVTPDGIHFDDGFLELTGPMYYGAGHVEADGTIVTPSGDRIEPDESESPPPPTPSPTPTPASDGGGATPTPDTGGDSTPPPPTPTPGQDDADGGTTPTPASDDASDDSGSGGGPQTPTPAEGPGFGAAAALVALLTAGIIVVRRG